MIHRKLSNVIGLRSIRTGMKYPIGYTDYTVIEDGVESHMEIEYDFDRIKHDLNNQDFTLKGMWKYKSFLPLDSIPSLNVIAGGTPLINIPGTSIYVKDEGRNPTCSLKDRASSLIVAKAIELGKRIITTASTGNAAAALAGMAAGVKIPKTGESLESRIFVPKTIPPAKLAQLQVFGAKVYLVDGSYSDAYDLSLLASKEFGWWSRSTGYNYYTSEGKKTVAFEIVEQLGECPSSVFVSVGDGNIISGLYTGFRDMLSVGIINSLPKIYGVQSKGSNAIAELWKSGKDPTKVPQLDIKCTTIADSISADRPSDYIRAVLAVSETNGEYLQVSDELILKSIPKLAQLTGIFSEPAAACSFAGLQKAIELKKVNLTDKIVVINTGSGLKDISAAINYFEKPIKIKNSLEEIFKLN